MLIPSLSFHHHHHIIIIIIAINRAYLFFVSYHHHRHIVIIIINIDRHNLSNPDVSCNPRPSFPSAVNEVTVIALRQSGTLSLSVLPRSWLRHTGNILCMMWERLYRRRLLVIIMYCIIFGSHTRERLYVKIPFDERGYSAKRRTRISRMFNKGLHILLLLESYSIYQIIKKLSKVFKQNITFTTVTNFYANYGWAEAGNIFMERFASPWTCMLSGVPSRLALPAHVYRSPPSIPSLVAATASAHTKLSLLLPLLFFLLFCTFHFHFFPCSSAIINNINGKTKSDNDGVSGGGKRKYESKAIGRRGKMVRDKHEKEKRQWLKKKIKSTCVGQRCVDARAW